MAIFQRIRSPTCYNKVVKSIGLTNDHPYTSVGVSSLSQLARNLSAEEADSCIRALYEIYTHIQKKYMFTRVP